VRLRLPEGFPTEVFVLERPDPGLLPAGPWVLLGDRAVEAGWRGAGLPVPPGSLFVPTSEAVKRLETILPWLESWAALPLHRDATIVAAGGGVLTDMAGLAASLYLRGVPWQSWPTTLLAQVDAGLGGKTAVNLAAGKNLAGAFHPPVRLVACRAFLDTLPAREREAGFWEVLKMALLEGDAAWAAALLADGADADGLARALTLKAEVMHRDPFERGERRLLNLGHTLGHALESASGHGLLHGEAVGLGLLAACELAGSTGLPGFGEAFRSALGARLEPLAPLVAPFEDCLPFLRRDKKAGGARSEIHCILPLPGRRAEIRALPAEAWREPHRRMVALLSGSRPHP
jgi:3-dehydroquinate synthase